MGRCYAVLNELQQAEECYVMCARVNPTDYDSRLRLAEILELTNRKTEAMEIIAAGLSYHNHD
jgi:thioredoxin-like negative regulator of GroEL